MIVTCGKCGARYAVDPLAIGPAGRTVQCARCNHRWFELVEAPRQAPDMVIRPITAGASLPAVIPPTPSFGWKRAVAVAVTLVLLLAAAMFLFRDKIAALISYEARASARAASAGNPPATPAQAMAQAPAVPPAASSLLWTGATNAGPNTARPAIIQAAQPQIEIDLSSSRIDVADGRYVVRGEIVNNGRAAGSTTLLRLTFMRNDEVVGERSFPLIAGPLAPGARVGFNQPLDDPPAGATDIVPLVE